MYSRAYIPGCSLLSLLCAVLCCAVLCCAVRRPKHLLTHLLTGLRTGYAPGSLLYGRELGAPERVATKWGSHSLVDAGE